MKISIIVPIYNVENYISKCLDSVKKQTLNDFECLLIDDGTKDNSIEVAKEVTKDDNRFVYFRKENGGLSDARNFGLEKATGEYVFFLDSDDYIKEDLLEKAYAMAKKHDSDITCFDIVYVYDDHTDINAINMKEVDSFNDNKELIYINHSANNKIFRRSFLEGKTFIKGLWYEDMATVPVWVGKANNVSYVNEALYFYVQRSGSISHSEDPRIFDVYKSINNLKKELNLDNKHVYNFYYYDCLIMTTLRIRDLSNKDTRKEYYKTNVDKLNENCPEWYMWTKDKNPSFKQKVLFYLLKHEYFDLLNLIY